MAWGAYARGRGLLVKTYQSPAAHQRMFDLATVREVLRMIQANEYKRRQAPPGVRITPRSFGKDWRYPLTSRFK